MVRPTKPKDMKPKTDSAAPAGAAGRESSGIDGNRLILVNAVTTVLICILFVGANYFMQDNLLSNKLKSVVTADGEQAQDGAEADQEAAEKGIIVDLGDFILNLSDVKPRRYLKVNVALELTKLDTDPSMDAPAEGGGHGGGHGESAAPDPAKIIEQEMAQYKPAIRDAVISTMSSKTADELSSVAGKELAKEQIQEAVNGIFNGEREVLRVSFGNFIIQ